MVGLDIVWPYPATLLSFDPVVNNIKVVIAYLMVCTSLLMGSGLIMAR